MKSSLSLPPVEPSTEMDLLTNQLHVQNLQKLSIKVLERKASIDSVHKSDRPTVKKIVQAVSKSLPVINPQYSSAHVRAVKNILKVDKAESRKDYTDTERRIALFEGMTGVRNVAAVSRLMGVPRSTFYFYRQQLIVKEHLRNPANADHIRSIINNMDFKSSGPSKLLCPAETDLLALKIDLRDAAGAGVARITMAVVCKDYFQSKADTLAEELGTRNSPKVLRLEKAVASKTFIKKNFLEDAGLSPGIADSKPKFTKTSGISTARAKAASPALANAMYEKFLSAYGFANLQIQKGVFPPGGPLACQVLNVDEVVKS